jgi:membrane protein required for colicin V production
MSLIDILILVGLALFIILGFRDGFFKKVFGILGFLAGLICATKFMNPVGDKIMRWLDFSKDTSHILAFLAIFLAIVLLEILFYRWFGSSGTGTLKIWSRFVGAIIGFGQGALAVSLILIMLNIIEIPSEEDKKESVLYHPVLNTAPIVFDYTTTWIPESKAFIDELKQHFEKLKFTR